MLHPEYLILGGVYKDRINKEKVKDMIVEKETVRTFDGFSVRHRQPKEDVAVEFDDDEYDLDELLDEDKVYKLYDDEKKPVGFLVASAAEEELDYDDDFDYSPYLQAWKEGSLPLDEKLTFIRLMADSLRDWRAAD